MADTFSHRHQSIMVTKIISGGQTGADQAGLFAARMLDIPTGGWAEKRWTTELGPQEALLRSFNLEPCMWPGYGPRTARNVAGSDGTVIFGKLGSAGSQLTMWKCLELTKPFIHFDVPWLMANRVERFQEWMEQGNIEVLNVAGNRESVNRGIGIAVMEFLVEALG